MALPENFLETLITAIVSGGGTAVSAILAFFRDVKRRIDDVERRVGSVEARSGLAYSVEELEDSVKRIEAWASNPPDWLMQLIRLGRRSAPSYGSDDFHEYDTKLRAINSRLQELIESIDKIERRLKQTVTEETFDVADRQRATEIADLRANISMTQGMIKGLESIFSMGKTPHR
jgi:tetrahydromethanopterin S-methyltransferase subunit G